MVHFYFTLSFQGESCTNLSRTALWLILLKRIFESDDISNGSAVTNECRCTMMDIFASYFRNSKFVCSCQWFLLVAKNSPGKRLFKFVFNALMDLTCNQYLSFEPFS